MFRLLSSLLSLFFSCVHVFEMDFDIFVTVLSVMIFSVVLCTIVVLTFFTFMVDGSHLLESVKCIWWYRCCAISDLIFSVVLELLMF